MILFSNIFIVTVIGCVVEVQTILCTHYPCIHLSVVLRPLAFSIESQVRAQDLLVEGGGYQVSLKLYKKHYQQIGVHYNILNCKITVILHVPKLSLVSRTRHGWGTRVLVTV